VPQGRSPCGLACVVRRLFWGLQALLALGLVMVVAGLLVEEVAPAAPILHVLALPIGLLPVLGPVWVVATPVLLVLMVLTRKRQGPARDA
jgi:hypothetical protein